MKSIDTMKATDLATRQEIAADLRISIDVLRVLERRTRNPLPMKKLGWKTARISVAAYRNWKQREFGKEAA